MEGTWYSSTSLLHFGGGYGVTQCIMNNPCLDGYGGALSIDQNA